MSLPVIKYPYLPEGREILYVEPDNEFMLAAKVAAGGKGCRKHATGAVIVKDGEIVSNGSNAGVHVSVCPRDYNGYKTGEGYHYCKNYCEQNGHAEEMACRKAEEKGIDVTGADVYLYGHWWACKNCWNHMIKSGIKNLYLQKGAKELFDTEVRTLGEIELKKPLHVYVAGAINGQQDNDNLFNFYQSIRKLLEAKGYSVFVPHVFDRNAPDFKASFVYEKDRAQVEQADLVIAYAGLKSLGVGMELEMANRYKSAVILLSEENNPISLMALGSPSVFDHIKFTDYKNALAQLEPALEKFLQVAKQENVSI